MLRVTTLYASSARATALYYTRYLAAAPGEEPGVWFGDQAIGLGLSGRVDADDLQLLLEGRDPPTGTSLGNLLVGRLLASGKVVRAVAGFDATFSAPKSVSVWWACSALCCQLRRRCAGRFRWRRRTIADGHPGSCHSKQHDRFGTRIAARNSDRPSSRS
jgi:TrwC relaxase